MAESSRDEGRGGRLFLAGPQVTRWSRRRLSRLRRLQRSLREEARFAFLVDALAKLPDLQPELERLGAADAVAGRLEALRSFALGESRIGRPGARQLSDGPADRHVASGRLDLQAYECPSLAGARPGRRRGRPGIGRGLPARRSPLHRPGRGAVRGQCRQQRASGKVRRRRRRCWRRRLAAEGPDHGRLHALQDGLG